MGVEGGRAEAEVPEREKGVCVCVRAKAWAG